MSDSVIGHRKSVAEGLVSGRRDLILDVATSLFAQNGFNDTDTQELAERLGVGKGTVYRCFASKRELFLAAVDRALSRLHQAMEASGVGVTDPLLIVSRAIKAYLDFFSRNPEYVELLIQERALFKDRKKPTYFEHRDRHADYWRSIHGGLIESGRVRSMPVDTIRDVINQVLYGTMFTNYFNGQDKSSDEQAHEIIDMIFHGLLSDSERSRRLACINQADDESGSPAA